ncbi:M48 family metallopeptidase [Bifidobacterium simiarum]|uniref:M48 family metallopeptidase n=1 Tax=Bifidobacterium simiarum TaxID=2045441 RepID=UPI001BDCEC2D|nr:SprT family zinc-dependent metalloprotease [Bifidobacterium simiarum]MBT1166938.1 M48 family metallopeptidase [Bifidobacterium simiarum]
MVSRTISVEILEVQGLRVKVTRKTVKNMYLRVKPPDGRVEVTAPARIGLDSVVRFVASRRPWIDRMRARLVQAQNEPATRVGQSWSEDRKSEAKALLNRRLPDLLARWTPVVGRAPTDISLRRMTSRWGSCTPATGRIRLNLELAYLPPQYLEYVLVHELTHLWERGHGAGFQRRMDRYLPDWRRLRRELNHMS